MPTENKIAGLSFEFSLIIIELYKKLIKQNEIAKTIGSITTGNDYKGYQPAGGQVPCDQKKTININT